LDALCPTSRMVVTMREIEGRSLKEVAELTGLTVAAVKIRTHRAKAKMRGALRQLLEKDGSADRHTPNTDWQPHLEMQPLTV